MTVEMMEMMESGKIMRTVEQLRMTLTVNVRKHPRKSHYYYDPE
jgi:hypothetical protein